MKRLNYVIFASSVASFGSVEALTAFPDLVVDRTFTDSSHQRVAHDEYRPPALIQLAKETSSTKTTIKTKNDGTVVTTEKTRTNDGEGNKTKTTTTTTTQPTSGGSGGASYEGE